MKIQLKQQAGLIPLRLARLVDERVLAAMPTLRQGHTADLKFETEEFRFWLSRLDREDMGSDVPDGFPVCVEQLWDNAWVTIYGGG